MSSLKQSRALPNEWGCVLRQTGLRSPQAAFWQSRGQTHWQSVPRWVLLGYVRRSPRGRGSVQKRGHGSHGIYQIPPGQDWLLSHGHSPLRHAQHEEMPIPDFHEPWRSWILSHTKYHKVSTFFALRVYMFSQTCHWQSSTGVPPTLYIYVCYLNLYVVGAPCASSCFWTCPFNILLILMPINQHSDFGSFLQQGTNFTREKGWTIGCWSNRHIITL